MIPGIDSYSEYIINSSGCWCWCQMFAALYVRVIPLVCLPYLPYLPALPALLIAVPCLEDLHPSYFASYSSTTVAQVDPTQFRFIRRAQLHDGCADLSRAAGLLNPYPAFHNWLTTPMKTGSSTRRFHVQGAYYSINKAA